MPLRRSFDSSSFSFSRSHSTTTMFGGGGGGGHYGTNMTYAPYNISNNNNGGGGAVSARKMSLFMNVQQKRSFPVAKAAILSTTTMLQQQQQQSQQPSVQQQQPPPPLRKTTPSTGIQQRMAQQQGQSDTTHRRRSIIAQLAAGGPLGVNQKRDSMAMIADLLAATSIGNSKKITQTSILESVGMERLLKVACVLSMITVCLNTPKTFQYLPYLTYPVLVIDFLVVIVFTLEAILKINNIEYFEKENRSSSYLRDRWDQFDFLMLIFHWLSFILHVYQCLTEMLPYFGLTYNHSLSIVRCVRPIISIRFIRLLIKFQLPRNRIQQLLRRSSSQVQNVTVFFVFFMAFYAIMGIQLFAHMDYHCVVPGTDPKNVTINDLAIPDTMCSMTGGGGYECPDNMECMKVDLSSKSQGFYGMFDHFGASVFTVYLAASEEGWVYVLYDCLDSLPSHIAFIYFVTLIFFLAWLVKNVFIAVITETFAEIRVQFSEMWQKKDVTIEDDFKQKIEKSEDGWRLVRLDMDNKNVSPRVRKFQAILRSTAFQCVLVALVLANAAIHATFVYRHDASDAQRREIYYYIEVGFTIFFDIECFIKIACYGIRPYFKRNIFKFEFILCVGSTLNVIKFFYDRNVFTYFQLFRILRLIKASPILEDFVYKIFSPGKKLGGLVIFTVTFVIIASAVSLQLFCMVPNLHHFQTFPQAFMSMFQIITQEGWTEFVVEVLRMVDDPMVPFVAIYFVAYHLFVTLILLSLFVAVILDNLEMDEELKKVKQLKAKEAISSMRTTLPWRLRVFDKFPTCPQMVKLRRQIDLNGEFPTPRLRDSFASQFVQEFEDVGILKLGRNAMDDGCNRKVLLKNIQPKSRPSGRSAPIFARHVGQLTIRANVDALMRNNFVRQFDLHGRTKSLGFFEKILTAENGDIVGRGGGAGGANAEGVTSGGGGAAGSGPSGGGTGGGAGGGGGGPPPPPSMSAVAASAASGDASAPNVAVVMNTRRMGVSAATGGSAAGTADTNQLQIDFRILQQKRQIAEMTRNRIEEDMRENHPFFDRPLFLVGRASRLRKFCCKIVNARYDHDSSASNENATGGSFTNGNTSAGKGAKKYKQIHQLIGLMPYLDWAMVTFTLISCISMLFESPWPTTGENLVMNNIYLQIPDYLFVMAMTFELWVKVIAGGLFFTPNALVRDAGGVMTIFIYFTSLIFLATMPRHVEINSVAQFLMICRAMRPLRIYTLVPHIRRVVVELIRGFREILLVTILMIIILFIFASFGVQSVGGKLAACNDASILNRENCTGVFWQKIFVTRMEVYGKNTDEMHPKILVPRVWTNPRNFNFDHIGNALLALFETLSYKGWNVIRDILWARQGPWAVVFIHIFVFIGCMIGLTLFVGVVIANYTENRGTALLTVDQRRWQDLKARLKMAQPLHVPPKPLADSVWRRRLYQFTMSRLFSQIFAVLVVFNSATLMLPWTVDEEDEKHELLYAITAVSAIINCLFAFEILLKVFAFSAAGFWQSRRNRIDLLITAMGILWVVMHFFIALPAGVVGGATRLKRFTYTFGYVVVVLRFFTIASRNSTLKMLMLTVVMSMFRSFFIIMAMVLLMLFYAYTGVILFGMVKYGQAVSKHVNFRSGSEALVVLFRSITGEDWNDIMHDSSKSTPFCYWRPGINYWESDCGNFYGAIIYFCSFYLIITYIVRNLLVAIIIENFSLFYSSEEDALLSYADIRNFQLVWNMVDVEQKGTIPIPRVKFLLRLLRGRLEVDPSKDRLLFKHMCYEMEKLHAGDDVSFHDVLYMLSYRSVDIRKSLQLEELVQREELEYVIEEEVAKQTIKLWLEFCLRKMRAPATNTLEAGSHHSHKDSSAHGGHSSALSLRSTTFDMADLTMPAQPLHAKLSIIPSTQNIAGTILSSDNGNDGTAVGSEDEDNDDDETTTTSEQLISTVASVSPKTSTLSKASMKERLVGGLTPGYTTAGTVNKHTTSNNNNHTLGWKMENDENFSDTVVNVLNSATIKQQQQEPQSVVSIPAQQPATVGGGKTRRRSITDVIEEAARKFILNQHSMDSTKIKKNSWSLTMQSESSFDSESTAPFSNRIAGRHVTTSQKYVKTLHSRDVLDNESHQAVHLPPRNAYQNCQQQSQQQTPPYTPPIYRSNHHNHQQHHVASKLGVEGPVVRKISGILTQPVLQSSGTTMTIAPQQVAELMNNNSTMAINSYFQQSCGVGQKHVSAVVEDIKDWWNNLSDTD